MIPPQLQGKVLFGTFISMIVPGKVHVVKGFFLMVFKVQLCTIKV